MISVVQHHDDRSVDAIALQAPSCSITGASACKAMHMYFVAAAKAVLQDLLIYAPPEDPKLQV